MTDRQMKDRKSEVSAIQTDDRLWHSLEPDAIFELLRVSESGLNDAEVAERQERHGKNYLPRRKAPSLFKVFLSQSANPLIYILIVAALVSVTIGEWTDAIFILGIILINAGLGTHQEYQAEKSAEALQKLLIVKAHVRRNGREAEIDAEHLVPGDIVMLSSGAKIPADIRLLKTSNFTVDESFLTGESLAVEKMAEETLPDDLPVSERRNMVFAGSTVTSGRATGVAVNIGLNTEVGKIAENALGSISAKTPLVLRMESFSRKIAIIVMIVSAILGVVAFARGYPLHDVFFMAVALAVAAIPEGLPIAMTVALSLGSKRMAKRNVIVRKLPAVEGLGSCTYIASDKTGTLTLNRQTVKRILLPDGSRYAVSGEGYEGDGDVFRAIGEGDEPDAPERKPLNVYESELFQRIGMASVLANDGQLALEGGKWQHDGDPVDVALLAFCCKLGLNPTEVREALEQPGSVPYESERQFAAQFFRENGQTRVAVKGALERLLPHFDSMLTLNGETKIEPEPLLHLSESLAEQGYRVLAIADGVVSSEPDWKHLKDDDLPPLTVLALVGMIDPLRPKVPEAIRNCQEAGVKVTMVTGDHPATALTIARQLGIAKNDSEIMTGKALEDLGEPQAPQFQQTLDQISVFARVAPMQKVKIVEALKHRGHFVAVTGDGVNDTPALRAAHIGVAMGSGSDIAKDAASIVVTDDNFASIAAGVEEGRFAYDNVRKVIFLLVSTALALVLLVTFSLVVDLPLPFHAVQLLWVNVVTNGVQDIALAFEKGDIDAMRQPPRDPRHGIFDRLMIAQNVVAAFTMGLVFLGVWALLLQRHDEAYARNELLLIVVLMQNFHTFNARSETKSAFQVPLRNNRVLMWGVLGAQALHITAMHVPFTQRLLSVNPASLPEWGESLLVASIILVVMEVFKWFLRRQHKREERTVSKRSMATSS